MRIVGSAHVRRMDLGSHCVLRRTNGDEMMFSGMNPCGSEHATRVGMDLIHEDITKQIIDVFYQVYKELGHGFLEKVYQTAMMMALSQAGLTVAQRVPFDVWFRGCPIGDFWADLVVNGVVLVEIKSASALHPRDEAQTLNYLRASSIEVALLMNFGPKPEYRRRIFTNDRKLARGVPRG
jgi:GxxExxY protein